MADLSAIACNCVDSACLGVDSTDLVIEVICGEDVSLRINRECSRPIEFSLRCRAAVASESALRLRASNKSRRSAQLDDDLRIGCGGEELTVGSDGQAVRIYEVCA